MLLIWQALHPGGILRQFRALHMTTEAAAPAPEAPKFRTFTVPPASVRLAVEDVIALLPDGLSA